MSIRKPSALVAVLVGTLSSSHAAFAQAPAPPVSPAPTVTPPVPATPTDAAQIPSPTPAPSQVAVPPGYMLVPIPDAQPKTAYDVQYPQARGALPPGMELPYEPGDPIPPGYHLREQPRRGLVIAGALMTGVPWALSVTAATAANFDNKLGFLFIPAIGPWLALATGAGKDKTCASTDEFCDGDRASARAVLVLDGLVQSAGATMLVIGLLVPRKRLVRDDVTLGLVPATLGRDGYGLGAVGTF